MYIYNEYKNWAPAWDHWSVSHCPHALHHHWTHHQKSVQKGLVDWHPHPSWCWMPRACRSPEAWKDNMLEVLELKANVKTYVQALDSSCRSVSSRSEISESPSSTTTWNLSIFLLYLSFLSGCKVGTPIIRRKSGNIYIVSVHLGNSHMQSGFLTSRSFPGFLQYAMTDLM